MDNEYTQLAPQMKQKHNLYLWMSSFESEVIQVRKTHLMTCQPENSDFYLSTSMQIWLCM